MKKKSHTKFQRITGRIELILGPMFSGKTSELIRRLSRFGYGKNKKKCIILKWNRDYRYKESTKIIQTHDGKEGICKRIPNRLMRESNDQQVEENILKEVENYDVVGIDEGHFFDKPGDLIEFCECMANQYNKIVLVAALESTYERKPFREISRLIAKVDKLTKLCAVCNDCSNDAPFSFRLDRSNSNLIEIGGSEKYVALCRSCYIFRKDNQ